MHKLFLLACSALISASCFASIDMDLNPKVPLVIESDVQLKDGTIVWGPWVQFDVAFTAAQDETVTGVVIEVTDSAGNKMEDRYMDSFYLFYGVPEVKSFIVESLPNATADRAYNVVMTVKGYGKDSNGKIVWLQDVFNFVTQ